MCDQQHFETTEQRPERKSSALAWRVARHSLTGWLSFQLQDCVQYDQSPIFFGSRCVEYTLSRVGGRHRARQPSGAGRLQIEIPYFSGSPVAGGYPPPGLTGTIFAFRMVALPVFLLGKCSNFMFALERVRATRPLPPSHPIANCHTSSLSQTSQDIPLQVEPSLLSNKVASSLHQWKLEILKGRSALYRHQRFDSQSAHPWHST